MLPVGDDGDLFNAGNVDHRCVYDLARFAFRKRWYTTLWLHQHLVKMIGAHNATVAAFSATVLVDWQPYSQLLPWLASTAAMIGFVLYYRRSMTGIDFGMNG